MFVATRYATKIRSGSNVCRYSICDELKGRVQMFEAPFVRMGSLYFLFRFGIYAKVGGNCGGDYGVNNRTSQL